MNQSISAERRRIKEGLFARWQPIYAERGIATIPCSADKLARQLTWRRYRTGWRLFAGRRRFGDVVPDRKYPGMWRPVKSDGQLSDLANLSWAKNAVLNAAERELEWEGRHRSAIDPSKSQQIVPVFESRSSPMRFSVSGVST